jgi:hypothetical protein
MTIIEIPGEDLAEADRLEAQAMQTDDPNVIAWLMRVVNMLRTPPNFPVLDHTRTELSEDLGLLAREDGVVTPSTPEDDGGMTPVHLVYKSGGGREIELGSYNLGKRGLRVLGDALFEFRRLLFELAVQADENKDDEVSPRRWSPTSSTTTSWGHGDE